MPENQDARLEDDAYSDPEVQAALKRLEATLDEAMQLSHRPTLFEILGLGNKKNRLDRNRPSRAA